MLHRLSRRAALMLGTVGAAVWAGGRAAYAALPKTPPQTAGPFYPPQAHRFGDEDADLVKIEGRVREAGGEILHLSGRVLDESGAPRAGAMLEIWQCDANGRYLHHRDRAGGRERDPDFQGYGALLTGDDGRYAFRTIRPVAYPGRTPHIHARITPLGGETLTTQLYVAGDAQNSRDGIFRRLGAEGQDAASMRLATRSDGDLEARFDFVV